MQSESVLNSNNKLKDLHNLSEALSLAVGKLQYQTLIFAALVILTILILAITRVPNILPVIYLVIAVYVSALVAYLFFETYQNTERGEKGDSAYYSRIIVKRGVRYSKSDAKEKLDDLSEHIGSILEDPTTDVTKLVEILSTCFQLLVTHRDVIIAANMLDKFSDNINKYYKKFYNTADGPRTISLKRIADIFDYACAATSHQAAKELLKKKQYRKALRYAELYTWVLSRCEDYFLCSKACDFAVELTDEYAQAYQGEFELATLARAEFLRIKALAISKLAEKWTEEYKQEEENAYEELPKLFRDSLMFKWTLDKDDWIRLDKEIPSVFSRDDSKTQNVQVVASLDDTIATTYILHWLQNINVQPVWIIKDEFFTSKNIAPKNTMLSVLVGGPEAWENNESVYILFKKKCTNEFLDLKAGSTTKAGILDFEKNSTLCCMVGGGSKIDTMQAAFEFSQSERVKKFLNNNTK